MRMDNAYLGESMWKLSMVVLLGLGLMVFGRVPLAEQQVAQYSRGPEPQPGMWDIFDPRDRRNLGPKQQLPLPYIPQPGAGQSALESAALPGFCIDVPRGYLYEGGFLYVFRCHSGVNQQLVYSRGQRGQIAIMPSGRDERNNLMCLDFDGAGQAGLPVRMRACRQLHQGQPNSQVWWPFERQIRSGLSGRCLAPSHLQPEGYAFLMLLDCAYPTRGRPTAYEWHNR